jgi:hypothetical protein
MKFSESFRTNDKATQKRELDVRKEAESMVKKHEQYLQKLQDQSESSEAFKDASLKATEAFKNQMHDFLAEHGREDLYDELVGFLSGKVSEIVSDQTSDTTSL